jgi:DegV family protein with EDD domain
MIEKRLKMTKVAIITDSTAAIPPELAAALNITVVPLTVNWDGQTYRDGFDISYQDFYSRLRQSKTLPTTSQASPGDFARVYDDLLGKGYDVFTLLISAGISGTYDSACQALTHFPGKKIKVMDSRQASMPLTMAAIRVAKAAQKGASLLEVENIAKDVCGRVKTYFALETLEFLHRGGRIGGAARLLGTALDLKPILTLDEGIIKAVGKVRTFKRATKSIYDIARKELGKNGKIDYLGLVATDESHLVQLEADARKLFEINELENGFISPVIGVHVGPGAFGFVYLPEK